MIKVELSFNSYVQALAALTALAAVAPDVLSSAQTTGLADVKPSAAVTPDKQAAAIASAQVGTAAAPPAPAPTPEKRGPGRPKKEDAKPTPGTPAEALAQALETPKMDYATSGLPERIAILAADPDVKAKLVAKIKELGGLSAEGKPNAKFIPAEKLPELAALVDELEGAGGESDDIA